MFVTRNSRGDISAISVGGVLAIIVLVLGLISLPWFLETVNKGTVKIGYKFGEYHSTLKPGGPYLVNPLVSWHEIDTTQKTAYYENVMLPTNDEQKSTVDLSIQYRAIGVGNLKTTTAAGEEVTLPAGHIILNETGSTDAVVEVHLNPHTEGALRDAGRNVEKAEDLFEESVVSAAETGMLDYLKPILRSKGFAIEAVILRDVQLPDLIRAAIDKKKERDQLAEQQKAELRRFETEQQQKIKTATAERDAAVLAAEKIRTLADANAYKIQVENEALSKSPAYVQLEGVRTLDKSKFIVVNGSAGNPIPFMNMTPMMAGATGSSDVKVDEKKK